MRRSALLLVAALLAGCAASASPTDPAASRASDATPLPAPAFTSRPVARGPEQVAERPSLSRPSQPAMAAGFRSDLVADHCVDRDLAAPPAADIVLTVLDRSHALPASYVPPDLVPAANAGLSGTSGTKLVRAVVVDDLAAMRAAWEAAGLTILIESAYRSYAAQAATFESWVAQLGYAEALVRSARPGHSEHQLGTALDLTSPGWGGRFGDWARETPEGAWLAAHAWEYGFVMSYPAGSQAETCFSYEPWHYRWIGREAAAAQRAAGRHLRPFLERFVDG